jgi:hypothetical protein
MASCSRCKEGTLVKQPPGWRVGQLVAGIVLTALLMPFVITGLLLLLMHGGAWLLLIAGGVAFGVVGRTISSSRYNHVCDKCGARVYLKQVALGSRLH